MVSSFDRHLDKFWTKQSIISEQFLKKFNEAKKSKNKKKQSAKKKVKKETKDEGFNDEKIMTLQKFYEYKLANIFGRAIMEFRERV